MAENNTSEDITVGAQDPAANAAAPAGEQAAAQPAGQVAGAPAAPAAPAPEAPAPAEAPAPTGEPAQLPDNPLDAKAGTASATPGTPATPEASADSAAPSDMIDNIVSTETSEGDERILEEAPELDMSLMQEVEPTKSAFLLVLKIAFAILVVVSVASFLFFTSQLTNTFDFASSTFNIPNISKDLASSNAEITTLQTDLNFYRYLQIKAFLDEFSYYGDSYLQNYDVANSQTAASSAKKKANSRLKKLRDKLRVSFMAVKDQLVHNFTVPIVSKDFESDADFVTLFRDHLTTKLTQKSEELLATADSQAMRDQKNYKYTKNLVANSDIKTLVLATDFDALSDKHLYKLVKDVNAKVVNDMSIIQEIKDKRIKWSDIINEIYLRTVAVDTYYSGDFYDEIGGIRYTSYDFDISGPSIAITGETKRFDTNNFTMIANLIDELNRSKFFENAEMKSFAKSGSTESGYVASLRLNLDLQTDEMTQQDEQTDLITRN